MKQNIILCDCEEKEIDELKKGLENTMHLHFTTLSYIANTIRKSLLSRLLIYFKYFGFPLKILFIRKKISIIIGWQQFYTLCLSFYYSLFNLKKRNVLIAMNFTYKRKNGILGKIYFYFMKKAVSVKYLDFIHVLSNNYADYISEIFNFPKKRIIVSKFGINDIFDNWKNSSVPFGFSDKKYVLSIGRSNRDFTFLLSAWKNIDCNLIIISDQFKLDNKQNHLKNVTVLNNISGDEQYPFFIHAKCIVIPIDNGQICSGDTVLLQAMSFKKTVIVTYPSTLGEMYIRNHFNGFLVEKNIEKFNEVIKYVLNNDVSSIEKNARQDFLENFSRYQMGKFIGTTINKILHDNNIIL